MWRAVDAAGFGPDGAAEQLADDAGAPRVRLDRAGRRVVDVGVVLDRRAIRQLYAAALADATNIDVAFG